MTVLDGAVAGFVLFMAVVGLSVAFGMTGVLNLAQGALFLGGVHLGARVAGWGGFLGALGVAAIVGLVTGGVLALMTEPLRGRSRVDQALLTLGVALVASELLVVGFGAVPPTPAAPPGLDGAVSLLGVSYLSYRLVLIGIGAVLAMAVTAVVHRTRAGALVRATVADREMVATLGVDDRLVRAAVFAVGSLLATTAGVLDGPVDGAGPGIDVMVLVLALVVVVVGGPGSVRGTLVAALVVGQVDVLGRALLPDLAPVVLLAALAVAVAVRRPGLLGEPRGATR